MDILTPKGQETLLQEHRAAEIFCRSFPGFEYIETPKDRPACFDGFIVKDDVLLSGVETKCRQLTYDELMNRFDGKWLITHDKVEKGISICEKLGVDFRGFLYLVPDDLLLIVSIWDYRRGLICDMEVEQTQTQATVNGGTAIRLNAYIDVTRAKKVR